MSSPSLNLPCKVISVYDGDTVTVEVIIRTQVRLLDCWAPELKEPKGHESRDFLKALIDNKYGILRVPLNVNRLDKLFTFGRLLGHLIIDDKNISEVMVEKGLATEKKQ